jgi:hyperosmotically inducible periplasmic protein
MSSIKLIVIAMAALVFLIGCGKNDADIQKRAQERLNAEGISGAAVSVKDGVATLTGEVADQTVKNRAEAAVRVDGVSSVNNQLTLKPLPAPTPAPPDPEFRGKVEENLRKAGCNDVKIEIKDGKVFASGKAPDDKFIECVRVIQESGASGFENLIEKGS